MRPHSLPAESHSFVGMARETAAMSPALTLTTLVRRREKRKKNRFYIYLDVTHAHTHTDGEPMCSTCENHAELGATLQSPRFPPWRKLISECLAQTGPGTSSLKALKIIFVIS